MDHPTLKLLYHNIFCDFKGLFCIRRLFCLGLIVGKIEIVCFHGKKFEVFFVLGSSLLDGWNFYMAKINPLGLPLDMVEEQHECKL